jgi:hypothetical protein
MPSARGRAEVSFAADTLSASGSGTKPLQLSSVVSFSSMAYLHFFRRYFWIGRGANRALKEAGVFLCFLHIACRMKIVFILGVPERALRCKVGARHLGGIDPIMRPAGTRTLFAEQPRAGQRFSSFAVSILIHAAVIGLFLDIYSRLQINIRMVPDRYAVRMVALHSPDPEVPRSAPSGSMYPSSQTLASMSSPDGSPAQPPSLSQPVVQPAPAVQTLVQPDIPPERLHPKKTPVPALLIWSAKNTQVKNIVPPPPHPAASSSVRPSLDPPNQETNVADIRLSSTEFTSIREMPLPSTTSPVAAGEAQQIERVPETASETTEPPAPAAVMSLSDLHTREGIVALPPANETAPATSSGERMAGPSERSAQTENNEPSNIGSGSGTGRGSGDRGQDSASAGAAGVQNRSHVAPGANTGSGQGNGHSSASLTQAKGKANSALAQRAGMRAGAGNGPGTESTPGHITLPPSGQFGAVVVGSSLEEQYPEIAGLWGGRLTYTVYLHVGLAKSWILQYSVPRAADAAAGGSVSHLEAPWPYDMVRPNLAPGDVDADALIVHGFVNEAGRFERLSLVFPPQFAQTALVLNALQQWQFRPAMQNGKNAEVEVLLVIPEEQE